MPEWLIAIFIFYCIYLIMTTSKKATSEKTVSKAKVAESVSEATPEKADSVSKAPKKAETTAKKSKPAQPKAVASEVALKDAELSTPETKAVTPAKKAVTSSTSKKTSGDSKPAKKTQTEPVTVQLATGTPEINVMERVGLTAGSIWQYLSSNGSTPVAKLIRELLEEEKIIQRSIGWLAQEDKIVLSIVDRIETVSLK